MSEYREFKEVTEIKYGSNGIHYSMWKGSPIHVIEYAAYEHACIEGDSLQELVLKQQRELDLLRQHRVSMSVIHDVDKLQKQNQLMRDALEKIRDNMHPDGLLYENIFISKDYAYNPAKQTLEKLDD